MMKLKLTAALLLLICPFAALCHSASAESEAAENGYEAYRLLSSAGIIGAFQYDGSADATRAQFTRWAVQISGDSLESPENIPTLFHDVANYGEYAGYIAAAYNLGYISGDGAGNFNPNAPILGEHALKITVSLLGYRYLAESSGGFPSGYLKVSNNLGLTKGVSVRSGVSLTQSGAMELLKNALEADLADIRTVGDTVEIKSERGRNLFNVIFSIEHKSGVLDANIYTGLLAPDSGLAEGFVSVGGVRFREGDSGASAFLGQYVKIYYRDVNDTPVIVYIAADKTKNTGISVNPNDISALNGNELLYTSNERELKAKISPTATLILNGKMAELSYEALIPEKGVITLISNDGDSVYDVIRVMAYEIFMVKGVSPSTESVSTKEGILIKLENDSPDYGLDIKKNGESVGFGVLSVGNLLLYAESAGPGLNLKTALISAQLVNGTLSETGEDYVCIDGVEYHAGKAFLRDYRDKTGKTGNFYIDVFGEIVYYEGKSDIVYGYLNGIKTGGFGNVTLRVFTENARWVTLDLKDKIKLDTETVTAEEAAGRFGTIKSQYRQMIRYLVNSDRLITEIQTAKSVPIGSVGEDAAINDDIFRISYEGSKPYRSTPRSFDGALFVEANAKIFSVPFQTGDVTDEESFFIAAPDRLAGDTSYTFTAYDADDMNESAVLEISALSQNIGAGSRFMVVKIIGKTLNPAGEQTDSLRGFWKGTELTFPTRLSSDSEVRDITSLKKGDVIQFTYDENGSVDSVRLCSQGDKYYIRNAPYAAYTVMQGEIKKSDAAKNKAILQYSQTASAGVVINETTVVYVYEPESDKYTPGTIADITPGDSFVASLNHLACREIIIIR
jgi:hypothetical protein